jgi:alpha-glucosidase
MKVCYTGGAVKDCGSYYSVATNAVELRIWFLTDDILRIRAGFDGDWDEASYSLTMTAWESRTDELMKNCSVYREIAMSQLSAAELEKEGV